MSQIKIYDQNATTVNKKKNTGIPFPTTGAKSNRHENYPTPNTDEFYKRRKRFKQKDVRGWLLVIATIAMAIYTYRLFDIATAQTYSAIKSANAAELASQIAWKQFLRDSVNNIMFAKSPKSRDSLNIKSFKLENRAYVNVASIDNFIPEVGKPISYDISFINTGKTPAYHMHTQADWKTGTGFYKQEIKIVDSLISKSVGTVIAGVKS